MPEKETKVVGFSFISPEVVIIHFTYSDKETEKSVHLYPNQSSDFELSELAESVVLVKTATKLKNLRRYEGKIDKLIVFDTPDKLKALGIPIADIAQEPSELCDRILVDITSSELAKLIETKSVPFSFSRLGGLKDLKKGEVPLKKKKALKKKTRTFSSLVKNVLASLDDVRHNTVIVAITKRILDLSSNEEFSLICKKIETWGATKKLSSQLYGWVEGVSGDGAALGKAVDKYFNPTGDEELSLVEISKEYQVSIEDMKFVIDQAQFLDETNG